jgi:hypothetical protein
MSRLEIALERSARAPRHPLEIGEQPFDRLLLSDSYCYRRNRDLARRLGIAFKPEVRSTLRAFRNFDPYARSIAYTPIESELRGLVSSRRPAVERESEFRVLSKWVTNLHHETSHSVLARLLRPSRPFRSARDLKLHSALVEALATLREYETAKELGALSAPLADAGVLYSWLVPDRLSSSVAFDEGTFAALVAYTFAQVMGTESRRFGSEISPRAGFRGVNPLLVEQVQPAWLAWLWKLHRTALMRESGWERSRICYEWDIDDRKFLSPNRTAALHAWYSRVFWPSH